MSFSFPLFTAAAAAAIVLLAGFVYLIIYCARINRALRSGQPSRMAAPRTVLGVAAVIVFAGAVFVSYLAGYKAAYDDFEGGPSSPAVEVPPMTMRDLAELPGVFDAALSHVEDDGADLTDARASLSDLGFLNGRFGYFSFMLYYDAGGERISRSVDVSGEGALFTEWWSSEEDQAAENSIPLGKLRQLLVALDGVDWPGGGEVESFNSLFGVVDAQMPGGYVLEGGALVPSTDAAGEYRVFEYISGDRMINIYVPAE